jgi:hypothetical protein
MVKRGPRAVLFWPAGREREGWPVSHGAMWRERVGEGSTRGRLPNHTVGAASGGAVGGSSARSRQGWAGE